MPRATCSPRRDGSCSSRRSTSATFVFTNQVPSTDGKVLMELAAPVTLAALGYVFDVKRTPNRETQFHGDFVVDETITAI